MASMDKTDETVTRDQSKGQNRPQERPAAPRSSHAPDEPSTPPHGSQATQDEAATPRAHLADTDNPTQLRWGLDDVLWCDDDSVIVLMSDEDLKPYWLELEADRAAVLRRNLAGPDGEQPANEETTDTLPEWLYQRFAVIHGCPPWGRTDDGERSYWVHQAAAVRRAVARGGFKNPEATA